MTVHTQPYAAEPTGDATSPPGLTRLRMRETALRQQAAQLQARAEHLERVGRAQAQQLQRRADAHEKIVLGALVKKAGLDLPLSNLSDDVDRRRIDGDAMPISKGFASQSTTYDRALILGALIWLAAALQHPATSRITMPNLERMRAIGQVALKTR